MKNLKKLTAVLLSAGLLTLGCVGLAQTYQPGIYTGEAQGFGGTVTVEIEVSEDAIVSVKATGESETPTIGGAALEPLGAAVLAAQSADIDGIAGATMTSNAVKEAAQQAIAAAKGEEKAEISLTPGTYTATQNGYQRRHVTVSVTVDEKSITDVQIVECTDNPITVTKTPCEQIPAAIVANQTYNVDAVTGATITSNAIKFAVKDCLDQAGGSVAFSAPVEKPEIVAGENVYTDILVVGGGGAGMVAAVEAYSGETASDANGLSVILIEKAGFLGGTTSVSGGAYYEYSDETGAYDDAWLDKVVASEKAIFEPFMNLEINEALVRNLSSVIPQANRKVRETGVNAPSGAWGIQLSPCDDHVEPEWSGAYLAYGMNKFLPMTGIDVRLNTRAMKILTDESGAAIGVSVQDKTSTYDIYAKKVILACGDFASNPDMIKQYGAGI